MPSPEGCPEVSVTGTGDLARLPAALEAAAFRIAQEPLTNSVRRAGASTVVIGMHAGDA